MPTQASNTWLIFAGQLVGLCLTCLALVGLYTLVFDLSIISLGLILTGSILTLLLAAIGYIGSLVCSDIITWLDERKGPLPAIPEDLRADISISYTNLAGQAVILRLKPTEPFVEYIDQQTFPHP